MTINTQDITYYGSQVYVYVYMYATCTCKSMNWSIFGSKFNFAQQSNDEDRRFIPQDAA